MLAAFVEGALTIDLTALKAAGQLTDAEFTAAVARQDQLTNKANVGLQFAALLGAKSNLDPATDTTTAAGLAADPAYLASQAAIRSVTNDDATALAAITLLNTAAADADPIAYVNTNAPAASGVVGTTFTLTTGVDAGAAFTGTAGNDTFIGTASATNPTINLGDSLDGGAGTDTLSIISNLAAAIPSITTTNIETYAITNSALTGGSFAVNSLSTAPTTVKFLGGSNIDFGLSGVGTGTAVALESEAGQLTLTLDAVTGTTDALALSLNGAKTTASVAAAGIETFNVSTTGAASTLAALTGAQGSKLVVTGDKALTITADLANTFTTIDASAATAAVKIGVATGGNVTVTGGTGDDRFHIVGLDTSDTINGGAGTDTLAVDADVTASDVSKVTLVEKLEFTAATTQDLSLVSATGITTFVSSLAAASTAFTNNESTFSHVVSGATAGAFAATAALDGPADILNVELANSVLTTLTATNYETVNLKSSIGAGTGTVTNTVGTLANSAAANVVITGDTNLTISAVGAQGTFDASALTGKLVVVGSAVADVIKGGSADDTITGGVGADVLTGGAGADIFVVSTLAASTDSTITAFDSITDFTSTDILRFLTGDNVAGATVGAAVAGTSVTISAGGKATFAAADNTLALKLVALAADDTNIANNEVVIFEQGSDTYVYGAGVSTLAPADQFLVKLVGVTGQTTLTESVTTGGDFSIA